MFKKKLLKKLWKNWLTLLWIFSLSAVKQGIANDTNESTTKLSTTDEVNTGSYSPFS